jgi:uncharacterized protein YggE
MGSVMTCEGRCKVAIVLLVILFAFPGAARAHDEAKQLPTLTVTGTGNLAVAPDRVFVTLGMETAGKSLAEAQRQNNSVMQKVTERLQELRIPKDHIQTSSFTISPRYKPPPKGATDSPPLSPEITGYTVGNSVTVEVHNLEKVGAMIEESLAAGANRFQGLHWALRDEQQAKLETLKQAAAKAREKATALSEALKMKLGRLISVNEGGQVIRPFSHASRSMMAMDGGSEPPIFSGEMQIEATVTLVYEIAGD